MIAGLKNIGTYQLSTLGVGAIAVGTADIRQSIDLILRTIPGSDPLRPLFGCNIYQYTDKPLTVTIPNGKKEIFEALSIWEPRIEIISISHSISNDSNVIFNIVYRLVDDDILAELYWSLGGIIDTGSDNGQIILSALIPMKVEGGVYYVTFIMDGELAYPKPPAAGFATATAMLTWINNNWMNYGRWYMNGTSLYVYMSPGVAKTATLSITQNVFITEKEFLPSLLIGEFYNFSLLLDGIEAVPDYPIDTINTLEQLIIWVQNNWSDYGNWTIETNHIPMPTGDFNNDFSNDFTSGNGFDNSNYLVFQTDKFSTAELTLI